MTSISKQIELHETKGREFVGLMFEGNKVKVYYPVFYDLKLDSPSFRDDVVKLIKLITITKKSLKDTDNHSQFDDMIDFPIDAYNFIWKEYKRHGRYFEKLNIYIENGPGKIDWKKTLRKMPDVVSDDFAYVNTINKSSRNHSTILTEIFEFCVYESVTKLQWLFGVNQNVIQAKFKKLTESRKRLYVKTLDFELNNTFDEDKKVLLFNMKCIVNSRSSGSGKVQVYGIETFDQVFEKLVYDAFNNVPDISEFYPEAHYGSLVDQTMCIPAGKEREDTIYINEETNELFIIDSKYYCDSRPTISSISKQIVYAENIESRHKQLSKIKKYDKDKIYNIFIRPADSNSDLISTDFSFACPDYKNGNKPYYKIYSIFVNLDKFIRNYGNNIDYKVLFNDLVHKLLKM